MEITTELQVLICTYGEDGIRSVATHKHPEAEGVEYVVSWQKSEGIEIPGTLRNRKDFHIYPTDSIGLCRNRNACLAHATAPFVLISDDDLDYEEDDLKRALQTFRENPELAILTFRYRNRQFPKSYPSFEFPLTSRPKGYSACSFEIGLNLRNILKHGRLPHFNEHFGIGTEFGSGEEEILIHDLLKAGHKGRFFPVEICEHFGPTTGERDRSEPRFIACKGAVISHIYPLSWPLRLIAHMLREPKRIGMTPLDYCRHWLRGIKKSRNCF